MLKNNFFRLATPLAGEEGTIKTTATFDSAHAIFGGHFPGLPVVPGVCMMGMVKEILEEKIGRRMTLQHAANIKFLSLINPGENESVAVEIKYKTGENGSITLDGTILSDNLTFFKITRAVYQ